MFTLSCLEILKHYLVIYLDSMMYHGSSGPPPAPSDMSLLLTNISTPRELPLYSLLLNFFCFGRLHLYVESCVVYSVVPGLFEATQCSSGSSTLLLGTRSPMKPRTFHHAHRPHFLCPPLTDGHSDYGCIWAAVGVGGHLFHIQ